MSLPLFLDCEQNCPYQPNESDQAPLHLAFQHNVPDPVYMEIEHLAYQIRQTGATALLVKKMSTALRAYEAIVKMEKRIVHARLEENLARIEAIYKSVTHTSEAENPPTESKVQEEDDASLIQQEKQQLIDEQVEVVENLPVLKGRKFIIPFSAKVTNAYGELCKLDESYQKDVEIANKVFLKIIDVLEAEWIAYVRNKSVSFTAVYLPVIVDFLQVEALKEATRMPLND